ncbi:hypothetical protein Cgig2_014670 [Carnegiea gigantea]|uniref:prolyl aminopeptidase n=1 Tax=Carnegiea gigantea TaxID=171969 RepID=A0A9Q1QSI3_9CARY|nr:hypothetical protein Cgig2_014670 [Carnegiea gigantea]
MMTHWVWGLRISSLKTLPLASIHPLYLFPRLPISSLSTHQHLILSGKRKLRLQVRNCVHSIEDQLIMALEGKAKEFSEVNRNLYSQIEPYSSGFLKVSDIHNIYWEQSGNPNGHPVVFLHGGPGGGTSPSNRRFFDPEFYRIILFDQRGAGKSTPHACLEENTTWDLISDIEKLREHLEVPEWQVTGLVLRGIFLLRKKEIDWFYEGGAAAIFPDGIEDIFFCFPQLAAAKAWTTWEMMTAHLIPNEENIKRGDDDNFSLAFARIENHYFVNRGFFPSDSFLLDQIEKIRHIKCTIVQGRYDVCCPMMSAWDLHKAWPEADFKVVPNAGHSANEPGIAAELVAANEMLNRHYQGKE